jgi:CheY-like chemotaxis protein
VAQILLIDDDGFYRGLIRQILEEGGTRSSKLRTAPKGVEQFRAQRPDLVLTDMRMPGVDGAEVIRSLRQLDRQARIIAVSGAATFCNVDYFQLAKEVGADAILRKLDPVERVLVEVNRILEAPVA